jgi:hypothetical protein
MAAARADQLIAALRDECIFSELLKADTGNLLDHAVSAHARASSIWNTVLRRRALWARQLDYDEVAAVSARVMAGMDLIAPAIDGHPTCKTLRSCNR